MSSTERYDFSVRNTITIVCLALLCVKPDAAKATQVLEMSLEAMVNKAHSIVMGTVISVRPGYVPEARGRIQTTVSIQTTENIKSPTTQLKQTNLQFVVPGGTVGRFGQKVAGTPEFTRGEQVLLFLEKQPKSGRLIIVGFSQGLYRILPTTKTMPAQAISDRHGIAMLTRNSKGKLMPSTKASHRHQQDVQALIGNIKKFMAASK